MPSIVLESIWGCRMGQVANGMFYCISFSKDRYFSFHTDSSETYIIINHRNLSIIIDKKQLHRYWRGQELGHLLLYRWIRVRSQIFASLDEKRAAMHRYCQGLRAFIIVQPEQTQSKIIDLCPSLQIKKSCVDIGNHFASFMHFVCLQKMLKFARNFASICFAKNAKFSRNRKCKSFHKKLPKFRKIIFAFSLLAKNGTL